MKVAIFDIDNCLADDSHRIPLIDHSQRNPDDCYRAYHDAARLDKPYHGCYVEAATMRGERIAFVTSRPEEYRESTWKWLRTNFNFPRGDLYMRPTNNHQHSAELKRDLVRRNLLDEDVMVAYDDRQSVLDMYQSLGIRNTRLLKIHDEAVYGHHDPEPVPLSIPNWNDSGTCCKKTVPQILEEMAFTYRERNKLYGSAYLRNGQIMHALFPDGINLHNPDDFIRMSIFNMIVSKVCRYAANLENGGHKDSARDLGVYAAMLESLTDEVPF